MVFYPHSRYEFDSGVLTAFRRQMVSLLPPSSTYQLSRGGSHISENKTASRWNEQNYWLGRSPFSELAPFRFRLCLHSRSGCRVRNDLDMDKNRRDDTISFPSQTCECTRSFRSIIWVSTLESKQTSRAMSKTDIWKRSRVYCLWRFKNQYRYTKATEWAPISAFYGLCFPMEIQYLWSYIMAIPFDTA